MTITFTQVTTVPLVVNMAANLVQGSMLQGEVQDEVQGENA